MKRIFKRPRAAVRIAAWLLLLMLLLTAAGCNAADLPDGEKDTNTQTDETTDAIKPLPAPAVPEDEALTGVLQAGMDAAWRSFKGELLVWTDQSRFRYYGTVNGQHVLFYCPNPNGSAYGVTDRATYAAAVGELVLYHNAPFALYVFCESASGILVRQLDAADTLKADEAARLLECHQAWQQTLGLPYQALFPACPLTEEQIQQLADLYYTETGRVLQWSRDLRNPSFYGTYGDCTVICQRLIPPTSSIIDPVWPIEWSSDGEPDRELTIGGFSLGDASCFLYYVYCDGSLLTLQEACRRGMLAWEDVREIAILHSLTEVIAFRRSELDFVLHSSYGRMTVEEAIRIEALWQAGHYVGESPIFVDADGRICYRGNSAFYGVYDAGTVIFCSVDEDAVGNAPSLLRIGAYTFTYEKSFTLFLVTDGEILPLKSAYDNGLLGDTVLRQIAWIHRAGGWHAAEDEYPIIYYTAC